MKHPFKIIGIFIIVGVIVYAAWPTQSVRGHNPRTGEGSHAEEHEHDHMEPTPLLRPEERAEILSETEGEEE